MTTTFFTGMGLLQMDLSTLAMIHSVQFVTKWIKQD
jgi:hypothetical protein